MLETMSDQVEFHFYTKENGQWIKKTWGKAKMQFKMDKNNVICHLEEIDCKNFKVPKETRDRLEAPGPRYDQVTVTNFNQENDSQKIERAETQEKLEEKLKKLQSASMPIPTQTIDTMKDRCVYGKAAL